MGAKNSIFGTNTPRLAISPEAARIDKYDSTAIHAANGACAMAVLGFVSLLISRGLQGSAWAMGVSVTLAALAFAFTTYAAAFGLVFLVSRVWNRSPANSAPTATRTHSTAASIDRSDELHPATRNESS